MNVPDRAPGGIRVAHEDIRILRELAGGRSPEMVARELGVSERTLRRRVRRLCDELGVATTIEAIVWAVKNQLV